MSVNITYNMDALPVTYECSNLVTSSAAAVLPIELDFLYDLVYQEARSVDKARQFVESTLLHELTSIYGLEDATACLGPADDVQTWLVSVSSLPVDEPYPALSDCYELVPGEGQECATFSGKMVGKVIGSTDTAEIITFIADELNSGAVTVGSKGKFTAKFLGTGFESDAENGKDNLPDPINEQVSPNDDGNDKMDVLGILLIVGIASTLSLLLVIVIRRRRRARVARAKDSMNAVHRANLDHDSYHSRAGFSDSMDFDNRSTSSSSIGNLSRRGSRVFETDEGDVSVEFPPAFYPNTHSFDVGSVMRSEVLGIHATGAVSAQASRRRTTSLDSSSDADSWAQADGMLGSLELQIEPVTGEV